MGTLSQEKAEEYQQIAALMHMDLDILEEVAKRSDMTLDQLRKQIALVIKNRDTLIEDPEVRRSRFGSASLMFSLAASGRIVSTSI